MSIQFEQRTSEAPPFIKDVIHRLEKEHLEIHKKLNKVESAFGSHPEDKDLKATLPARALHGRRVKQHPL